MKTVSKIGLGSALFVVFVIIYLYASGQLGTIYLNPTEVGIKVNYITGSKTLLISSGNHFFTPVIEKVFVLDSSPQKFVMSGNRDKSSNHVRKLTVRAKDGSNFYFEEIEIQYQIIKERADFILTDSGPEDAYKFKWLKPISRMVLRNEFGRYSSEDMANPTMYGSAKVKSKEILNKALNSHGIRVIDISTPKPRFDDIYEKTIEARINADQEVEKQKVKIQKLEAEKKYRVEKIKNDKEIEYRQIEGELKRLKLSTEKEQLQSKKEADMYRIEQVGIGDAQKTESETVAEARMEQYKKDAEALSVKLKAMEAQGDAIVYKILAEKYKDMKIEFQPYSIDSTPQHIKVESIGAVQGR